MYIFALLPHSRTSRSDQVAPWHLVILNKWFNTHRLFHWRWETSLSYEPTQGRFSFHAYWVKSHKVDKVEDAYFHKEWTLPWRRK